MTRTPSGKDGMHSWPALVAPGHRGAAADPRESRSAIFSGDQRFPRSLFGVARHQRAFSNPHDAYNFARMVVPNVVLAWPTEHSLDGWQMNGLVMPGRDGHARLQPAGSTAGRQASINGGAPPQDSGLRSLCRPSGVATRRHRSSNTAVARERSC